MKLTVNQQSIFCYTGGKPFNPAQPTAVFIHGVLNDHSVWILQTRYLAHHGWNVLAIDLPGHGKSEGNCPRSVEQAARFILDLLDAADVQKAALIGHSWGSLIALHAASMAPERVSHLVLVGTASPMRVSAALLENAVSNPAAAIRMVNTFSHSTLAPPPSALGPGTWLYGGSAALMRRVLASNTHENVFHTGFVACDSYNGADAAMAGVAASSVQVLFVLGQFDQMTPPKAAQGLLQACPQARVVNVPAGHQMMVEAPEQVLQALGTHLRC
jgi:pimeloyl-ACP methyl ester carboxylesterase